MPVVVDGVPELKKALKKFAPDLLKEMNAEIKTALKEVTKDAIAKVPGQAPGNLYNWNDNGAVTKSRTSKFRSFPKYDADVIKKGLTYSLAKQKRNRAGFAGLYSLLNKSAAGQIIELAGRVNPNGRPISHVVMINKRYKPTPMTVHTTKDSQSNNPNAGKIFIGAMNDIGALKMYGNSKNTRGRLLYAAYAENKGKALDATMKAIEKATAALNARTKVNRGV